MELELHTISPMKRSMPPWMLRDLNALSMKYGERRVFSK